MSTPNKARVDAERLRNALQDIMCRCLAKSHKNKFAHALAAVADEALNPGTAPPTPNPTTKRCIDCLDYKPLDSFYVNRGSNDGLQSRCKPCDNNKRMGTYRRGTGVARDVKRNADGSLTFVDRKAAAR